MSSEADQFGDPHKGLAADQMGKPAGQVPLAFALEPSPQKIGDDKAQNSVTEEFEALVAANGALARRMPAASLDRAQHARMGQGFLEEFRPGKVIPDYLREAFPRQKVCPTAAQSTLWNNRLYRIAKGHFQNCHHGAVRSVEKKMNLAGPTRLSAGT